MKNALNNQVGMLGDMFLWLVANLKQGIIYFIKQECGNHKLHESIKNVIHELGPDIQMMDPFGCFST